MRQNSSRASAEGEATVWSVSQRWQAAYLFAVILAGIGSLFSFAPRLAFCFHYNQDMCQVLFWLQEGSDSLLVLLQLAGAAYTRSWRLHQARVHVAFNAKLKRAAGSRRWSISALRDDDHPQTSSKGAQHGEHAATNSIFKVVLGSAVPMVCDFLALKKSRRYIKWVGSMRLLYFINYQRVFSMLESNLEVPYVVPPMLRNMLILCFTVHYVACVLWVLARAKDFSDDSWVGTHRPDLIGASTTAQYLDSLYFSVITMSTVGYGDISPVSTAETVLILVTSLLNIMVVANIVGGVSALASMKDTDLAEKRVRITRFERMLRHENISAEVATATLEYLRLGLRTRYDVDTSSLPPSVRIRIREERFGGVLRSLPLFGGASTRFVARCVARVVEDAYARGQELVRCGDMASRLCVILEGMAAIEVPAQSKANLNLSTGVLDPTAPTEEIVSPGRGGAQEKGCAVVTLHSGAVFGAESFICQMPEPFTIVAGSLLRCISLDEKDRGEMDQLFSDDLQCVRRNLLQATRRIRKTAERLWDNYTTSLTSEQSTTRSESSDLLQAPQFRLVREPVRLHDLSMSVIPPVLVANPTATARVATDAARVERLIVRVSDKATQALSALYCQLASTGDDAELSRLFAMVPPKDLPGDYDGRTPLHLAAAEGHADCTRKQRRLSCHPSRRRHSERRVRRQPRGSQRADAARRSRSREPSARNRADSRKGWSTSAPRRPARHHALSRCERRRHHSYPKLHVSQP